jgi:ABC-type transport system involved in cytochrome c biogenesis permease subunit
MEKISFSTFGIIASVLWILGIIIIYAGKNKILPRFAGSGLILAGIIAIASYIILSWNGFERPLLASTGETVFWFIGLVSLISLSVFLIWKSKWLLACGILLAVLFTGIIIFYPVRFEKNLLPALQSPWLVPHVVVYLLAYSILGLSTLISIYGLYSHYAGRFENRTMMITDKLVYIGFFLLSLGLVFGIIWAKEVWGHYWRWELKEILALSTWLVYLVYLHVRHYHPAKVGLGLWILVLAFAILIVTWFGMRYFPTVRWSLHIFR